MGRQSNSFRKAAWLPLVVALGVGTVLLVVWAPVSSATVPRAQAAPVPPQPVAQPSTILGTTFYTGTVTGTHMVWVGAFTTTMGGPPAFFTTRSGPGPYTLTVEAGTYHIIGGMDADDSGGAPNPAIDPMGAYAGNPVTVTAGTTMAAVSFVLLDPASPPTGTGSISGWIGYTGRNPGTHNIIVFAGRQGQQGPPAYATVMTGTGPYTLTNVVDGTYTVGAFMDLGGDMGPPRPNEPFGWYDPGGDGQPDPVIVSGGNALTGIDVTLHDPQRTIFLPLILIRYPVPDGP